MSKDNISGNSYQVSIPMNSYQGTNNQAQIKLDGNILATVILPAYNEAMAISKVLDELFLVLGEQYEVLVIDDGSTDNTADLAANYPCRLIRHASNRGKGAAVRTGIHYARGQYIVIMDADATYPASAIPEIIKALGTHEMVRCVRQSNNDSMPVINKIGNRLFDVLLTRILGLGGGDHLSGLYGVQRKIIEQMDLESNGFDLETEISFKATNRGIKITSFPINYQSRLGEKKLRPFRDGTRILNRVLMMILVYNPTMVFVIPGLLILGMAIIGAVVLSNNALITPYFGLDVHSFILAASGVLGGFQLVIFGIAVSLYAVEAGYKARPWLIMVSSAPIRLGTAGFGLILTFLAALYILKMTLGWLVQGAGPFGNTRELVSMVTIMVGGMQLLSAAMFISIFAGRLERNKTKSTLVYEELRQ